MGRMLGLLGGMCLLLAMLAGQIHTQIRQEKFDAQVRSLNASAARETVDDWAFVERLADPMLDTDLSYVPAFRDTIRSSPLGRLLEPGRQRFMLDQEQRFFYQPQDLFKPEEPFDLSGPAPKDEDVRAAIVKGVYYLLDQQKPNGSWDVVLEDGFLANTADEAMDAVMVTSLCGLALRPHMQVDPQRIDAALASAREFVMDRIIRGKLSTRIYYACWRYSFGLQFLTREYPFVKDADMQSEMRTVATRMVQSLLDMQLSNSKAPVLERKRKARIANAKDAYPSTLGVRMDQSAPGQDGKIKGGAVIKEVLAGSAAEKAGLLAGDRILEVDGLKLFSPYDYFDQEVTFLSGQKVNFQVWRNGEKKSVTATLDKTWPGDLGFVVKDDPQGLLIGEFTYKSPAKGAGLEVGDKIVEVNKKVVTTRGEYNDAIAGILAGKSTSIKVLRGKSSKSVSYSLPPAARGTFGFQLNEEDKGDLDGVLIQVGWDMEDIENIMAGKEPTPTAAELAGLLDDDRITHVGGLPIKGIDHFAMLESTLPAGRELTLTVNRDGTQLQIPITPAAVPIPANIGVTLRQDMDEAVLAAADRDGPAAKAGLKGGDQIKKIDGYRIQWWFHLERFLQFCKAGQVVKVTIQRGNKEMDFDVTLAEGKPAPEQEVYEEGGWNYYPMGVATSFTTSSIILNFVSTMQTMKIKIPESALASAANMVNKTRRKDGLNKAEGYEYYKDSGDLGQDVRGHMGRICVCDLAMTYAGRRGKGDLANSLALWLKFRGELDRVRLFNGTHNYDLYANAAYYWLFGHYYAVVSANYLKGSVQTKVQETVLKAMMKTYYPETGTWLGHPAFGHLVGTAQGLMVMGEMDGGFRKDYPAPRPPKESSAASTDEGESETPEETTSQ